MTSYERWNEIVNRIKPDLATWMSRLCSFFFSSRRRHTRFDCDWSSDVCSSDLAGGVFLWEGVLKFVYTNQGVGRFTKIGIPAPHVMATFIGGLEIVGGILLIAGRSEERRVGEEGRSRWSPDHLKKKKKKSYGNM